MSSILAGDAWIEAMAAEWGVDPVVVALSLSMTPPPMGYAGGKYNRIVRAFVGRRLRYTVRRKGRTVTRGAWQWVGRD